MESVLVHSQPYTSQGISWNGSYAPHKCIYDCNVLVQQKNQRDLYVAADVAHDVEILPNGTINVTAYPSDYAPCFRDCDLVSTYPWDFSLINGKRCCGLLKNYISPSHVNVFINLTHFKPLRKKEDSFANKYLQVTEINEILQHMNKKHAD